jgi:hypothetical protein
MKYWEGLLRSKSSEAVLIAVVLLSPNKKESRWERKK